jgi:hypothetical protein
LGKRNINIPGYQTLTPHTETEKDTEQAGKRRVRQIFSINWFVLASPTIMIPMDWSPGAIVQIKSNYLKTV